MLKKKVLFIIPSLGVGGAEKSLSELLNNFDHNKYDIHLLMFRPEGKFLKKIDKKVNIRHIDFEEKLLMTNGKKSIKELLKRKKYLLVLKKIRISIIYRLFRKQINESSLFWGNFSNYFKKNEIEYDVAIAYLQGICAYYTIDKINAKRKILWMHTDYDSYSKKSELDKNYNKKFQDIVTVSESARVNFVKYYPEMKEHVHVIYNMINKESILKLSKEPNEIDKRNLNIVSVGRLHYAKGFDLVIPAMSRLRNEGYKFKWFIIGEGPERKKLTKEIKKYNLVNTCILLGEKENPYKYMKSADIYLQPSRYEGYCITLAEAIVLGKPIITTNFFGAQEQVKDQFTGLIIEANEKEIYQSLSKLINDKSLRYELILNLKNEIKNNINQISKVYKLIDDE